MTYPVAILAIWRITSLLVKEDGPLDMFARFRDLAGVRYDEYSQCTGNPLAKGLCCFWCASIWVAIPSVLLGFQWYDIFALSAGAILIEEGLQAWRARTP